jgi:hypothetical protein
VFDVGVRKRKFIKFRIVLSIQEEGDCGFELVFREEFQEKIITQTF